MIYPVDQAAEYLDGRPASLGWTAGRAAGSLAAGGRAIGQRRPVMKRVVRWQREVAQLVDALADPLARPEAPTATDHVALLESCSEVVYGLEELPERLHRAAIRLPPCFRTFDQQPADLAALVHGFGHPWQGRRKPLLIVGVRTSGSYLAPLRAAFLKAEGWEHVHLLTVRPECRLVKQERKLVPSVASEGGFALITDDPPATP